MTARPGDVRAADEWWAGCTDERRVRYWRWLGGRSASQPAPLTGQVDAADLLPDLDLTQE